MSRLGGVLCVVLGAALVPAARVEPGGPSIHHHPKFALSVCSVDPHPCCPVVSSRRRFPHALIFEFFVMWHVLLSRALRCPAPRRILRPWLFRRQTLGLEPKLDCRSKQLACAANPTPKRHHHLPHGRDGAGLPRSLRSLCPNCHIPVMQPGSGAVRQVCPPIERHRVLAPRQPTR